MSHKKRRRKVKPKSNPNYVKAPYRVWFMAFEHMPPELGGYPTVRSVTKDPIPFHHYKVIRPGKYEPTTD